VLLPVISIYCNIFKLGDALRQSDKPTFLQHSLD
jgi:hypothetical protein